VNKKKKKTLKLKDLDAQAQRLCTPIQTNKSFLLLFFKKDAASFAST